MGLPVYSSSSSKPNPHNASMSDPTARARSAIRREPTVRSHRPPRFTNGPPRATDVQNNLATDNYLDILHNSEDPGVPATWENLTGGRPHAGRTDTPRGYVSVETFEVPDSDAPRPYQADSDPNAQPWVPHNYFRDRRARIWPALNRHRDRSPRPRSRRGPPAGDGAFPPLRRMSRRSIADEVSPRDRRHRRSVHLPPAPEVNGLGDRQRSWSPESDHDHWETLLNTITPDPSLPSASSSFGSGPNNGENSTSLGVTNPSNGQQLPPISNLNNTNTAPSRSISPMPPPYMATPETDNDRNEQEDNENCDIPPLLTLASPTTTSASAAPSNHGAAVSNSDLSESELDSTNVARISSMGSQRRVPTGSTRLHTRLEQADIVSEFTDVCEAFADTVRNMGEAPIDQRTLELVETVVSRIRTIQPAMGVILRDYPNDAAPVGPWR